MSEESKEQSGLLDVYTIPQIEPLFTVRPRYYENLARGNRGVRASFKLMEKRSSRFRTSNSSISDAIKKELFAEGGKPYSDFLITDLSYGFVEKMQLTQVFGDHTVAYAFGASPVILNIQGIVTDDIDNDWFTRFIFLYKDFLRGTQMARNFELARLATHNAIYDGVIMDLNMSHNSLNDALVTFNMRFLVRSFEFYSAQTYREDAVIDQDTAETLQQNLDGTMSYKDMKGSALKTKLDALNAKSGQFTNFKDTLQNKAYASVEAAKQKAEGAINDALGGGSATLKGLLNKAGTEPKSMDASGVAQLSTSTASFANVSSPVAATSGRVTDAFNSLFKKVDAKKSSILRLKVVGVYTDTVTSLNTKVETLGGFLDEVKRNLETLNKKLSYTPDPFKDLTDVIKKARSTVKTFSDIVGLVKQTKALLTRKWDIFGELNAQLEGLRKDVRNARGAVSSFSTNSSNKLVFSMNSRSDDDLPFLGNNRAGVLGADAANKLRALRSASVAESMTIPNPTPLSRPRTIEPNSINL